MRSSPLLFALTHLNASAVCNDDHFVRFESVKATDKAGVPLLAFSAHFKVTGTKERKTISRNKGNSTSSSHSSVHSSTSSLPLAGNAAPAVASASAGQIEGDILTEEELIANSGAIKLSFSLFLTISLAVVYTLF